MKLKLVVSSLVTLGVIAASPLAFGAAKDLTSATTPADADYPKVGGNLGNQNYSSLTQINKSNINNLGAVWSLHVSSAPTTVPVAAAGTTTTGQQTAPIVVDGIIYTDTPVGGVIAVNGKTGVVKWKWTPTTANPGFGPTGTRRGVSHGVAAGVPAIFTLAAGNRVVALNRETGALLWATQPTGPGGLALGNIAKVGTVYSDGMVYAGGNDGNRNAGFAVNANNGAIVWSFYSGPDNTGTIFTDVNGVSFNPGATWGPPQNGASCAISSGSSPWMHPAVDPELNMVYWVFGNARSCRSSQDGQLRPGDNLFSVSMVAVDAKTGAYKWHFQSQRHGYHDMDNVQPPTVGDVQVNGQTRKAIYYGSKASTTFILDRTNGKPIPAVLERPVPQDSRQSDVPFQPHPIARSWVHDCIVYEALSPNNIPGDPYRAVPNYNGYQAGARKPDGSLPLVYTPGNYLDADKPFLTIPAGYVGNNGELPTSDNNGGTTEAHRLGCLWDPHWDLPLLSTTTQNGGNDWSGTAFSHNLGLYITPYAVNNVAHDRGEGSNGLRAPGQYQTGGVLALNAATGQVVWRNHTGLDQAHGQTPLVTASDLVFWGQPDGWFVAADAATGNNLWKFQMGAGGGQGAAAYTIDGEQYIVVLAFGSGTPYSGGTDGDLMWAFKLGGTASEGPTPDPLVIRRGGGGNPTAGSTVNNTILLARTSATGAESTSTGANFPNNMSVPVGTTVTFSNPASSTKTHCATQFFEGLFNIKVAPGASDTYTFTREGEYWYNDCADPRPTGRIQVVLTPQDMPGAATIFPNPLNLQSPTGVFTGVGGAVTISMTVPAGYVLDKVAPSRVTLKTPLSTTLFDATFAAQGGNLVKASFDKAVIDNNIPAGASVPLTFTANFINDGVQKQLTSTVNVQVVK